MNVRILLWCYLPVLSAQFMTAPTGRASDIRNLAPTAPPRPAKKHNPDFRKNVGKTKTLLRIRSRLEPPHLAVSREIIVKDYDPTNCIENTNKTHPFN
jgi:hypothetical protein